MRTLVLGDVHANPWALEAVLAAAGPVDAVFCTGDLVDYGPAPRACVEWAEAAATRTVRGNHDHGVAQHVPPRGGNPLRDLAVAARPRQYEQLSPAHLRFLARLPVCDAFRHDGWDVLMVHGSPRDPLDDYAPADPDGWGPRLEGVAADLVLVGHTHRPYLIEAERPGGGTVTILNPGSVGQPRDGDPRAAFALIEDGTPSLHRVAYDPAGALAAVRDCDWPGEVRATAEALLIGGGIDPPHAPPAPRVRPEPRRRTRAAAAVG